MTRWRPASIAMALADAALELIAPARCLDCGRALAPRSGPLCLRCTTRLPWWRAVDGCPRCGFDPLPRDEAFGAHSEPLDVCPGCLSSGSALHRCHALMRYEGRVREWIPRFKHAAAPFGPGAELSGVIRLLAEELARQTRARSPRRPDLLVPIPMHPRRLRARGFNHAEPIARTLSRTLERPWRSDVLVRRRNTKPQAQLEGAARRHNVQGAFLARLGSAPPERVWLVDDVLTTGATLDAAASALLDAGVEEVVAICLAATRPRRHYVFETDPHSPDGRRFFVRTTSDAIRREGGASRVGPVSCRGPSGSPPEPISGPGPAL